MDLNNVVSAFIGAFLGVTTGFLGAFFLDWRRVARERRTHILALVREMLSNNVRIQLLLKDRRRSGGLEDRAWRDLRVPLAGELSMELYNRIASLYDSFAEVRRYYEELTTEELANAQGKAAEQQRALALWAERNMEDHDRLRAEVGERKDGLLRAVRRRERRQTEQEAARHTEAGTRT